MKHSLSFCLNSSSETKYKIYYIGLLPSKKGGDQNKIIK